MDYANGQMSMYNDRFAKKCSLKKYSTCGGVHKSNIQLALITPTTFTKFFLYYFCDLLKLCCFRFLQVLCLFLFLCELLF